MCIRDRFYTLAGPEIAVATTKAYSTQLVATYALAIQFAKVRGEISEERYVELIKEVKTLPEKIAKILEDKERIQWFASKQVNAHDVFFVGRGIDYAICMEMCIRDSIRRDVFSCFNGNIITRWIYSCIGI